MRKSCLIVAGLVVLVGFACVLTVGGWLVWSRFVKPAVKPEAERAKSTMRETGKRVELPWVDVRLHTAREGTSFVGWPLLVRASVRCPLSADTQEPKPIVITSSNGSWHDSLRLVVQDSKGTSLQWPWRQPAAEGGPITVDGQVGIEWVWWLTGEETQKIQPGNYSFKAILDTSGATDSGAWKGTASSRPTNLVLEPARQYSPEEEARHEIHAARAEALGGNNAGATTRLEALSRREPKNVEALSLTAALLAEGGRLDEALQLYNRAIEAWYENSFEPAVDPVLLLRDRREVRRRLLAEEP